MKKSIAALLLFVILFNVVGVSAESAATFDHTILTGKDRYQYDKFEKRWRFATGFVCEDEHYFGSFVITCGGDKRTVMCLPAAIIHIKLNARQIKCEKVIMLVNDNAITVQIPQTSTSLDMFVPSDKDVVSMIANADALSIRFYAEDRKWDFEVSNEELKAFQDSIKLLIDNHLFESLTDLGNKSIISME